MTIYFVNQKSGKKFKVLRIDGANVVMQGEFAKFTEPFNKELFKRLGYRPVEERDDAIQPELRAELRS